MEGRGGEGKERGRARRRQSVPLRAKGGVRRGDKQCAEVWSSRPRVAPLQLYVCCVRACS